jgi:hypothetical protein
MLDSQLQRFQQAGKPSKKVIEGEPTYRILELQEYTTALQFVPQQPKS